MNDNNAPTTLRGAGDDAPAPKTNVASTRSFTVPGVDLREVLGRGGMAVVYSGLDLGFNPPRQVAVKFMDPELSADPEFRRRFEREASLVGDFRHDHIVHVYSSGVSGDARYLVMEYLSGGSLADRIARGPVPPPSAITIARDLADALSYSHARGVVHRDFKPGNVLFTSDGKPVLTDFGVAKATTPGQEAMTKYAMVVGAPRYMAPEQALAEEATDRSDVYSWGLTLYEMIAGRLPPAPMRITRDDTAADALAAELSAAPRELRRLIERCLHGVPSQRPSAAECTRALADSASTVISTGDASVTRTAQRYRSSILAAIALVAVGGIALFWLQSKPPTDTTSVAIANEPMRLTAQITPPSALLFVDGRPITNPSAPLPAGKHTVAVVASGFYGETRMLTVSPEVPVSLDVSLSPVSLPSPSELDSFFNLADARTISEEQLQSVAERTLSTVLAYKYRTQIADVAELQRIQAGIDALAHAGDARAAVSGLLLASLRDELITRAHVSDAVIAASDSGDAMASFFVAAGYREELSGSDSPTAASEPAFKEYCRRMQMAVTQGWSAVATSYLEQDHCAH